MLRPKGTLLNVIEAINAVLLGDAPLKVLRDVRDACIAVGNILPEDTDVESVLSYGPVAHEDLAKNHATAQVNEWVDEPFATELSTTIAEEAAQKAALGDMGVAQEAPECAQ